MIEKTLLLKILLTPTFMSGMKSQKNYMGFIPKVKVNWAPSCAKATEDRKAQLCLLKALDMPVHQSFSADGNVGVIDQYFFLFYSSYYVYKNFD